MFFFFLVQLNNLRIDQKSIRNRKKSYANLDGEKNSDVPLFREGLGLLLGNVWDGLGQPLGTFWGFLDVLLAFG